MIAKWGSKVSPNHISKDRAAVVAFVKKSKSTIKKKYGVDNVSQIPGVNEKKQRTLLKNYGVSHPSQIDANRVASGDRSRAFFSSLCSSITITGMREPLVANKLLQFQCHNCGDQGCLPSETFKWRIKKLSTPCTRCSGVRRGSVFQKEIALFLQSIYSGVILENDRRVLNGLEIDILLPDLRIGIEANGVYWHSTQSVEEDLAYKNYHCHKTDVCQAHGINLIHIFEDDWLLKKEIIKGRLTSLISPNKMHVHHCSIAWPSVSEQQLFLESNHLQGWVASSLCVGLEHDEKLVAMMLLDRPRFSKNHDWELLRFCVLSGVSITGGASELFKVFSDAFPDARVISQADRAWDSGDIYSKLGFEAAGKSRPSYRWIKDLQSWGRHKLQKHKLAGVLDNFDPSLSQTQNMFNNGWRRIWDCGTTRWILHSAAAAVAEPADL